jgi:hypothetical protein
MAATIPQLSLFLTTVLVLSGLSAAANGSEIIRSYDLTFEENCSSDFSLFENFLLHRNSPVDEFGEIPLNDQRGRLDSYFAELENNPSNVGFVTIIQKNQRMAQKKIDFILAHARFRKVKFSKFVFGVLVENRRRTVLWRVPPGAEFPCDNCRIVLGSTSK